jgi:hypothetical protein
LWGGSTYSMGEQHHQVVAAGTHSTRKQFRSREGTGRHIVWHRRRKKGWFQKC